jgi:hypothetical protein
MPILGYQEVLALSTLGRRTEAQRALDDFLAIDWGNTIWGPAQLLTVIGGAPPSAQARRADAERCVRWYERQGPSVKLPWEYKAQRFAGCLYGAERFDRAEAVLRELVDSLDRKAMTDAAAQPTPPPQLVVLRANRIDAWGLLGRVMALRGNKTEAEDVIRLLAALPPPSAALHGYYYEQAMPIAAALGDRERAMDLARRARMNGDLARAGRHVASIFDPALSRFQHDGAFLEAAGLIPHEPARKLAAHR